MVVKPLHGLINRNHLFVEFLLLFNLSSKTIAFKQFMKAVLQNLKREASTGVFITFHLRLCSKASSYIKLSDVV